MVDVEVIDITNEQKYKKTGEQDFYGRDTYSGKCYICGQVAVVPFCPDGKRPIYCASCLKIKREQKKHD